MENINKYICETKRYHDILKIATTCCKHRHDGSHSNYPMYENYEDKGFSKVNKKTKQIMAKIILNLIPSTKHGNQRQEHNV
jgi:hypothetical protein